LEEKYAPKKQKVELKNQTEQKKGKKDKRKWVIMFKIIITIPLQKDIAIYLFITFYFKYFKKFMNVFW
jgi:hypothetical protein